MLFERRTPGMNGAPRILVYLGVCLNREPSQTRSWASNLLLNHWTIPTKHGGDLQSYFCCFKGVHLGQSPIRFFCFFLFFRGQISLGVFHGKKRRFRFLWQAGLINEINQFVGMKPHEFAPTSVPPGMTMCHSAPTKRRRCPKRDRGPGWFGSYLLAKWG